jgi:hypothetical protein
MADISALLSNAAQTNADFDLGKINKSYWEGRDQAFKNDLRDAFKDGVPMKDGQLETQTIMKTLFQKGDVAGGIGLMSAAAGAQDRAALAGIDGQPAPLVSPPSSSRTASAVVAQPLNRGGELSQGQPQAPQEAAVQPTLMTVLAQHFPNDQLSTVSASVGRQLGVDPTAPLNLNDPQVRNVLVPAIQQLKRQGVGQVQPPQPGDNAPRQPLAPQDDQVLKRLTLLAASPDKAVAAAAQTRLKSYLAAQEPTTEIKNYNFASQNPAMDERTQENTVAEARGKAQGEAYSKKYDAIADAGTKAQQEIPQLQMLQEQMNDPNFFSGAGEKYNFLYKQLKSAVGIDPNASVPQEFLRKATAANVLGSLGQLKGLGQIRVAEIGLAKDASAAPNTSVPANKLLTEMSIRTHQRNADIADLAQAYTQRNGGLDAGFDKIATDYGKSHPLFTDAEIKDWRLAIGQAGNEGRGKLAGQQAAASSSNQTFASPEDALRAGKKSGDIVTDASGKKWRLK